MKSPKAAAPAPEAPAMPIPPHGGSFVLNEESNTLTHVPLPVPESDTVEGGVEPPVKANSEEAE
ncbi:hypothetical protein [Cypionkella psychrotolerans]|uniref:hypothetical protein n=1 Tax=Cypionkella psychrotolerans TaxID=1678131 RepID=UPI0006B58C1F|nr:hypothetical protein [Cypionkella psychrotolerans]